MKISFFLVEIGALALATACRTQQKNWDHSQMTTEIVIRMECHRMQKEGKAPYRTMKKNTLNKNWLLLWRQDAKAAHAPEFRIDVAPNCIERIKTLIVVIKILLN